MPSDDHLCPGCNKAMEVVHTASCNLCGFEFTHPDPDAVDMQIVDHLIEKHGLSESDIFVNQKP